MNHPGFKLNTAIIRSVLSVYKKIGPRGGVWGENGGVLPPFGAFGAGKDYFFIIFMINWTAFAVGVVILWMRLNWTN